MLAAEITGCGDPARTIRIVEDAPMPRPRVGELLVRVEASSVNPLDCRRRRGYGRTVLGVMGAGRIPYIPGRDCVGVVEAIGPAVRRFRPGDRVWAAQSPARPGTQAAYVVVPATDAAPAPTSLSAIEAAAVPYAALSAWSALVGRGGLGPGRSAGKRVAILGAAGGIGTIAIQLAVAWGAKVAATCRGAGAVAALQALGADPVLDSGQGDPCLRLAGYDVVLDTIGGETTTRALRMVRPGGRLVTLITPVLPLTDRLGLPAGLAASAACGLADRVRAGITGGRRLVWAFVRPDGRVLGTLAEMADRGELRPLVAEIYPLARLAEAHARWEAGGVIGKIVIEVSPGGRATRPG